MNPAQRILLAARLWLHQNESSAHLGNKDEQAAVAAVRKEFEQSHNNNKEQNTMSRHYDNVQPSSNQNNLPPSIGRDNQLIMDEMTRVRKVAITLGRAGHRVLDISVGNRNARLTISPSNRCHMLGGAMIKITRMNGIEEKTMAANIEGVQVEWTTTSKLSRASNE